MAEGRTREIERGLALGAGVGFLLARMKGFDIGLGLMMGALAGVGWALLSPREQEDDAAPRH